MNTTYLKLPLLTLTAAICASAWPAPLIHVVHEPRQISTCSSKSENAWTPCAWCGSRTGYERTYSWNAYSREWVETTKCTPKLCRKCRHKQKEHEKLAREEAALDRKIAEKETRARIAQKRQLLRNWN